ncbi:hypothetical protein FEM21_26370 [Flavobacterium seoulense]|uniref:Uncharacterized protein n=1 Tax=Flavobacterium seoulense TaxID=1492738 RepID=A0A066WJR8_9FLAO|nr:hypothetical protein FEM21_26370 [Flavobacterium seoulense]
MERTKANIFSNLDILVYIGMYSVINYFSHSNEKVKQLLLIRE